MNRLYLILIFVLATSSAKAVDFNANKAWENLTAQCAFGPRDPGGIGHQKCLLWLESELKKFGVPVERQNFMGRDGVANQPRQLTNLVAHFPGQKSERILLCAHWDTRPWADMDKELSNRSKPILGANDGASGVAVLLEIARCLSSKKPAVSVEIALFDGEVSGAGRPLEQVLARLPRVRPETAITIALGGYLAGYGG